MIYFYPSWSSFWLLIFYLVCTVNTSQRYPYSFWKCCESKGNASETGNNTPQECHKHPCVPRCCRGHKIMLTTPPTSHKESLFGFCSTPPLQKKSWSPWTSAILRVVNQTRISQTRYVPTTQSDGFQSFPREYCELFRVKLEDELSLALLEDGRLKLTVENTTRMLAVLENFCFEGSYGGTGGNSHEDERRTPEEKEVVVVYFCSGFSEGIYTAEKKIVPLPACSDLVHPLEKLLQIPETLFRTKTFEANASFAVRLKAVNNDGVSKCSEYKDITLDFEGSEVNYLFDGSGLLFFVNGSVRPYFPHDFCIKSVFHNSLGLRVCHDWMTDEDFKQWWEWLSLVTLILAFTLSGLFYLAIAVVYILRKDKEPVFRCCIVSYSISMTFAYVLFKCYSYFAFDSDDFPKQDKIAYFLIFFHLFGFSWMSVLCFDVWLNLTFLRPGRESTKRLWGYVLFTLILPTVLVGVLAFKESLRLRHFYDTPHPAESALGYLFQGSFMGLACINFLLFLATAVKLWISQHSSDIKNQKKTFMLYFKLFLLVGLRWVIDFLISSDNGTASLRPISVPLILLFLHPIVLFFFLGWDAETRKYLETNYPRVKRALAIISVIGYPVKKCWGLWNCKRPEEQSGTETIEPPHNSTHMYIHTKRVPNIAK